MILWRIFQILSLIWIVSEIVLGRLTYSHTQPTRKRDRNSLRILWITITLSVTFGIFCGLSRIGALPFPSAPILLIGLFLIAAGLIIRWIAVLTLRRYFTSNVKILPEHHLVQHGIYAIIRHPAYAGALLSFLGLGIAFDSWCSLVVIFFPITAAFMYRIRVEEAALQEAFGEEYQSYCHRTRRLIPGVY